MLLATKGAELLVGLPARGVSAPAVNYFSKFLFLFYKIVSIRLVKTQFFLPLKGEAHIENLGRTKERVSFFFHFFFLFRVVDEIDVWKSCEE